MNNVTLAIKSWAAWAPGIESQSDWHEWANGRRLIGDEGSPSLTEVPAMLRRRLSRQGKMALWTAYQLIQHSDNLPCVFSSQHGDVLRTLGLLGDLAEDESLSPTAFGLSVHNAISGIHSIAHKEHNNITAISAGPDGICAALLEARAMINEKSTSEVLCVIYEEPLPPLFANTLTHPSQPSAASFLVTASQGTKIEISLGNPPQTVNCDQPTLDFLKFLMSSESICLPISSEGRHWQLRKYTY